MAPITRWQGTTIGIGLDPFAVPTAREAVIGWPSERASAPYVVVVPGGIVRSASQTPRSNGVPFTTVRDLVDRSHVAVEVALETLARAERRAPLHQPHVAPVAPHPGPHAVLVVAEVDRTQTRIVADDQQLPDRRGQPFQVEVHYLQEHPEARPVASS